MKKLAAMGVLLLVLVLAGCSTPPSASSQEAAPPPASAPSQTEPSQGAAQPVSEASERAPEQIQTAPHENVVNTADQSADQSLRIRLSFAGGEAIAVLTDSPTTQSLLKQLPVTVMMEDFAGAEKIAYFPERLSREGAPEGYDPALGDVACYGPWGNLAIFYKDQPYASGLIPMGTVESGLNALAAQTGSFKVVFQKTDNTKEEK